MNETERQIVEWLRSEANKWHRKEQGYRRAGNNGPYLGQPSGHTFASAIERGEHKSTDDGTA